MFRRKMSLLLRNMERDNVTRDCIVYVWSRQLMAVSLSMARSRRRDRVDF